MRILAIIVLTGCAPAESAPQRARTFNERVVELTEGYPARGFGGYVWPARGGAAGTSRDLRFGADVIAKAGDGNHCVGMTFEVYWRALEACRGGVRRAFRDAAAARAFRAAWYVPVDGGAGAAEALERYGLGTRVALADAQPGDFVQAWTHDRTVGHSFVFLGADRDETGAITQIRYWSSQPWTDGIGESHMTLGNGGYDPAQIYVARARCRAP